MAVDTSTTSSVFPQYIYRFLSSSSFIHSCSSSLLVVTEVDGCPREVAVLIDVSLSRFQLRHTRHPHRIGSEGRVGLVEHRQVTPEPSLVPIHLLVGHRKRLGEGEVLFRLIRHVLFRRDELFSPLPCRSSEQFEGWSSSLWSRNHRGGDLFFHIDRDRRTTTPHHQGSVLRHVLFRRDELFRPPPC